MGSIYMIYNYDIDVKQMIYTDGAEKKWSRYTDIF